MVRPLLIAGGLVVVSWAVLVVLARRLPPGEATDLATVLPACVTMVKRLRRDRRVLRRAKLVVALAGLWVLSPIDPIPEFIPVIGPLDDVIVVALAFRYAARQVPREVLFEAWPAEPRMEQPDTGAPRTPIDVSLLGAMSDAERDTRATGGTGRAGRASSCRLQRQALALASTLWPVAKARAGR